MGCKKDIFTWSIKEIFDFFLTENPNIKIRLTNFGYLHPEHVKFSSETTANVCTCIYHQSIILTLDSIHKHLQEVLKLWKKTETKDKQAKWMKWKEINGRKKQEIWGTKWGTFSTLKTEILLCLPLCWGLERTLSVRSS